MLGVMFFHSVIFRRWNKEFSTKFFLYPIKYIVSLNSNLKRHSTLDHSIFAKLQEFAKSIWQCSELFYERFEDFLHAAENVTRIIYARRHFTH